MSRAKMRVAGVLVVLALAGLGLGAALPAQGGWLDRARELLTGGEGQQGPDALTAEEIGAALKEALRVGTESVVRQLGRADGFNGDPAVHIPLPDQLGTVRNLLQKVGASGLLDELELKLNRAAEDATPKAKALFWQAVSDMTFADARSILDGPDDAATAYLREKMGTALAGEMEPVVAESLAGVGAIHAYDEVMGRYRALPFVPEVDADLTAYVVAKAMDGIFYYVAREEAAIRANPAERTTELLRRVFGME